MTEYWKSQEKKFCDLCKCWLTDNKTSIAFHENGNRHKAAVQKRLKDIHHKNKADDKKDKKMDREMRKIEEAAMAAAKKDMEENPDVSMKIQSYHDQLKKEAGETESPEAAGSKGTVILHRSEKEKKADEAVLADMQKPTKSYNRFSGWDTKKEKTVSNFFELPSASSTSKSPGTCLKFAAKVKEASPISFKEKTLDTSIPTITGIKREAPDVTLIKRKVRKGNMRERVDDN